MTTLSETIDATQHEVLLDEDLEADPGSLFRLEDEIVRLLGYKVPLRPRSLDRAYVRFERGVEGTTKAAHTSGAELLGVADAFVAGEDEDPPSPFAASTAGGGLPEGWTQSEVDGSVDAGGQDFYAGNISASGALVTSGGLVTLNGIEILKLTSDPTSGGGQSAALGSLGLRSNGQAWLKTGAGNTQWTQLGGSPAGAIQVVRVPIAFDTANLVLTGITAYTPAAGDVLLDSSYLSITTDWDGTTPGIYLYSVGDDTSSEAIVSHFGLQAANTPDGDHRGIVAATMGAMYLNASSGQHIALNDTTVLKLMVDDGSAGDPVSTQGEGVFVLIIAPAS